MRDKGYIKLSRKFFSNRMWNEARVFSECEAWLDLIQSARFEATVTIEHIGGREVSYTRGQYPAAVSFLLKRWGWSSDKKVRNFLDRLKREGMITTDRKQGMNVITLCKYDEYNSSENAKGEPKGKGLGNSIDQELNELAIKLGELKARQKAIEGQAEGNNKKKVNKENNIKKISTIIDIPPHPANVRQISDVTLQCQCTSQSTNEQCKRKALYEVDGKLYCNQHSKDVLGDIIENNPNLSIPDVKPKTNFDKFNDWLKDNTPNVLKIKSQITEAQFSKIKEKYEYSQIIEILQSMENYKELTKKYTSVYLTFSKWAKREYEK